MLKITIPGREWFDDSTCEFKTTKPCVLALEHSLVSISKWEQKWHKPFLSSGFSQKTPEEWLDYIRCMTLTQNVDESVYLNITQENVEEITNYINDPMTATWFKSKPGEKRNSREIITNEIIYYWMVELQIPVEFQKWHLNHLLTLIRVINEKKAPKKKMSKRDLANRNHAINQARRAASGSKG